MRSVVLQDRVTALAHAIAGRGFTTEADYTEALNILFGDADIRGVAEDPYYGIKTRNRRGARAAYELQRRAFVLSAVGKRNARGRNYGNPFTYPERRKAFEQALKDVRRALPNARVETVRKLAHSAARNVPVAKKARAA